MRRPTTAALALAAFSAGGWQPLTLTTATLVLSPACLIAQGAAAARQSGTVKSVAGTAVMLTNTAGQAITVRTSAETHFLLLAPGSTDLKSATPAQLSDVLPGDKILATGVGGEATGTLTANRVILIKSADIAARDAAERRDWQRRGTGGLVQTVNGGEIVVTAGPHTEKIETTPSTVFRRYADDSVEFADAKTGSLSQIKPGDQVRARGNFSDDRTSLTADEVVSGAFDNFAGTLTAVDAAAGTLSLKDLASKKTISLTVSRKVNARKLSPEEAAAFTTRSRPSGGAASVPPADGARSGETGKAVGAHAPSGGAPGERHAGTDLAQMLNRLPTTTLADLKTGDAVMIVASRRSGADPTVLTLLSGVGPILSATPAGAQPLTLSPWNVAAPEAGEGGSQ